MKESIPERKNRIIYDIRCYDKFSPLDKYNKIIPLKEINDYQIHIILGLACLTKK